MTFDDRLAELASAAVQTQAEAHIAAALGSADQGGIIEQVVAAALNEQVTKPGDRYASSRDKRPWIAWLVQDLIRKSVQAAIHELLVQETDAIRTEIERQLQQKSTQRTIAKQLIEQGTSRRSWKINVQFGGDA